MNDLRCANCLINVQGAVATVPRAITMWKGTALCLDCLKSEPTYPRPKGVPN